MTAPKIFRSRNNALVNELIEYQRQTLFSSATDTVPNALETDMKKQTGSTYAPTVPLFKSVKRLTDQSLSKNLEKLSKRIESDAKYALELLQKAGIANKAGGLAKRYGG